MTSKNKQKKYMPNQDNLNTAQLIMTGALNPEYKNEESNQSWDDLEGIYKSCTEALVVANNSVVELFRIPGVSENIENRQETKISILGLDKDIKFFSNQLKEIHEIHKGKTGLIKDEDELGTCLEIFEKYHSFQTTYQSVIIPTVITLSEEVGKAAQRMNDAIRKEQEILDIQNPNVITEVLPKENISDTSSPVIVEIKKEQTND
jgi:hypothetical protein